MTDEPITAAELAEWKTLADAATSGPWDTLGTLDECPMVWDNSNDAIVDLLPDKWAGTRFRPYFEPEDAAFIAAARTAVPRLLAEVERLRAALSDSPTHADIDAAQFEINRLTAQLAAANARSERLAKLLDQHRYMVNAGIVGVVNGMIDYRRRNTTSFQLEKLDDYIYLLEQEKERLSKFWREIDAALAGQADGGGQGE